MQTPSHKAFCLLTHPQTLRSISITMKPVVEQREHEASGVQKDVAFSIKESNVPFLEHILRNTMYSDPEMAVVREYSTNAVDAHRAAGKADVSIEVSLPDLVDCFLKIRDYGAGLSDDEMQGLYCSYGESSKRGNNDDTGMLGIGCKSGFSYGQSLMVNSYRDGTVSTWSFYIGEDNRSHGSQMFSGPTELANGLEVIIPVKRDDISKFHDRALHLFSFFRVAPKLLNVQQHVIEKLEQQRARKPLYSGADWLYMGGKSQSYAVMGNIPYPIDADVFGNDISTEMKGIVEAGVILYFDIGELEFAASREQLQYTAHTKKSIIAKLSTMNTTLVGELTKGFANCKTLWEAKILYRKVYHEAGELFAFSYLIKTQTEFQGTPLTSDYFEAVHNSSASAEASHVFYKEGPYSKMKKDGAVQIQAHPEHLVVYNDKRLLIGTQNRVVGLIESKKYKKVYVLRFKDDAMYQAWLADNKFDGPVVKISDLPKEPLSKYYPKLVSRSNNPKHLSKEFELDINSGGWTSSDFWKPVTVDPEEAEGVYLEIERFQYIDRHGTLRKPDHLHSTLHTLKAAGVVIPVIYGFKKKSAEQARNNPEMVLFWEWYQDAIDQHLQTMGEIEQAYVDSQHVRGLRNMPHLETALLPANESKPWSADPKSLMSKFLADAKTMLNEDKAKEIQAFHNLRGLSNNHKITRVPVADLKADADALVARYPLLFQMLRQVGSNLVWQDETVTCLRDYITMIDLMTP
jgi:hypothetical protein